MGGKDARVETPASIENENHHLPFSDYASLLVYPLNIKHLSSQVLWNVGESDESRILWPVEPLVSLSSIIVLEL